MDRKIEMQPVNRRDMMRIVGGGAVTGVIAAMLPNLALADAASTAEAVKQALGGKTPTEGRITLETPQIAENGNTVPITFEVESPMTDDNYVKSVHLFADRNPRPHVAVCHFTPACGKARASTRMRMIKTQNVIAVAEMSDGSVFMSKSEVKVTIGGCGG